MKGNTFIKMIRAHQLVFGILSILFIVNIIVFGVLFSLQEKSFNAFQERYQALRILKNSPKTSESDPFVKARKELDQFYETLETSSGFMKMVGELKDQVSQSGLKVEKMSFNPEVMEYQGIVKYKTALVVSGEYGQLKKILAGLTNSSRKVCIEKLAFNNDSDEVENVNMELVFSTYYREKT